MNRIKNLICIKLSFSQHRESWKKHHLSILLLLLSLVSAEAQQVLKPMPAEQWHGNYQSYLKQAEGIRDLGSVDHHYQLGQWAWENGLEDEAWEQWIFALRIDSDHAATRKVMGYVKKSGSDEWTRAGEINSAWIASLDAAQRGLSLTISIEDDADALFFDEFKWRLHRLNEFLWQITEGQIYIKDIQVQDQSIGSSDAFLHRIVIPKGQLRIPVMKGGGALCKNSGRANWQVFSGGRCYVRILAHEICHGLFALPDERHGCYCLMQGGLYGIKTQDLKLCSASSHQIASSIPVSCWSLIQKRYPYMKHPNPIKYGRVPETKIHITDR